MGGWEVKERQWDREEKKIREEEETKEERQIVGRE
jgi:hypothetical protein